MTRRKVNIRPELIGELFLKPGEDIPYRLILCNTEPTAVIQRVDNPVPETPTGISGLSGLILLKPVRPIEKPKKPRADSGGTHRKRASKSSTEKSQEIADKKGGNLTDLISTFSVTVGQANKPHTLKMGEVAVSCLTLREGAMELLATFGIGEKYVEDAPDSEGKRNLLNILKGGR